MMFNDLKRRIRKKIWAWRIRRQWRARVVGIEELAARQNSPWKITRPAPSPAAGKGGGGDDNKAA